MLFTLPWTNAVNNLLKYLLEASLISIIGAHAVRYGNIISARREPLTKDRRLFNNSHRWWSCLLFGSRGATIPLVVAVLVHVTLLFWQIGFENGSTLYERGNLDVTFLKDVNLRTPIKALGYVEATNWCAEYTETGLKRYSRPANLSDGKYFLKAVNSYGHHIFHHVNKDYRLRTFTIRNESYACEGSSPGSLRLNHPPKTVWVSFSPTVFPNVTVFISDKRQGEPSKCTFMKLSDKQAAKVCTFMGDLTQLKNEVESQNYTADGRDPLLEFERHHLPRYIWTEEVKGDGFAIMSNPGTAVRGFVFTIFLVPVYLLVMWIWARRGALPMMSARRLELILYNPWTGTRQSVELNEHQFLAVRKKGGVEYLSIRHSLAGEEILIGKGYGTEGQQERMAGILARNDSETDDNGETVITLDA